MAEWSVKPAWKKSIIERSYYHKDGNTVMIETGWRGGEFIVYTEDDNPPDISEGVDIYNCDYETELVETFDGCWEEHVMDECDEETQTWLEEFLEENSWLDLEEHGWMQGDTEMIIDCELIIERIDGETPEVLPELAPIVEESVPAVEAKEILEAPAKWPFATEPSVTEEEVVLEVTDWFPVSTNPVYVGVYEILTDDLPTWPFPSTAEWNGKEWVGVSTVTQWRGLANDPGVTNGN